MIFLFCLPETLQFGHCSSRTTESQCSIEYAVFLLFFSFGLRGRFWRWVAKLLPCPHQPTSTCGLWMPWLQCPDPTPQYLSPIFPITTLFWQKRCPVAKNSNLSVELMLWWLYWTQLCPQAFSALRSKRWQSTMLPGSPLTFTKSFSCVINWSSHCIVFLWRTDAHQ